MKFDWEEIVAAPVGILVCVAYFGTYIGTDVKLPDSALVSADPVTKTYATYDCVNKGQVAPSFWQGNVSAALHPASRWRIADIKGYAKPDAVCQEAGGFVVGKSNMTMDAYHSIMRRVFHG